MIYYTIKQLVKADWFPHKRYGIQKLIDRGHLKVVNVGIGTRNRWMIPEDSVKKYLNSLNDQSNSKNIA
jgi:hypothetical protein